MGWSLWIILTFLLAILIRASISKQMRPPLPVRPVPTAAQLKWHRRELIMFFHFGMNTFTDSEWGTGYESPSVFDPMALNASQWVDVAAGAGFSLVILTAKHHDGFCLWPSAYTDHCVKRSPWKGGSGDVVQELVDAATAHGVDVGLYLSPWDRHERTYGQELEYNEYYLAQLEELLTRYGTISEIWFDGAKGNNSKNMNYYFQNWFARVKSMQGSINIFSDAGPDIRWVGDETGSAGETCWSPINRTMLRIGDSSLVSYINTGDARGTDWVPPECDVSIRKGWFWHKNESARPLSKLLDIYYKSVGRNCVMLLNVPPNTTGLISLPDIKRLKEFHTALHTIFELDLAKGGTVKASSQRGGKGDGYAAENILDDNHNTYWAPRDDNSEHGYHHWIELQGLNKGVSFNVIRIQEAIEMGQRIWQHEVWADGRRIVNGTTIGHKRLHRLERPIQVACIRVKILGSREIPLLTAVGLHFDPYWKRQEEYRHL